MPVIAGVASKGIRIVLTADTHLGFDLPAHARVARRRRGEDFFANYFRVLDHAVRVRAQILVHGGDFFFRSRVSPWIVNRAFEALAAVAAAGVSVVIAPGNHDRSRLPPSLWLGHPNVHLLDRPRTVLVETAGGRVAVGGFPFFRGDLRAEFPRRLAETGVLRTAADVRLLCVHQAVAGARVGPADFEFMPGREVISPAMLPRRLTAVLAGHIHRAQVLDAHDGPPVFYPGSVERTSFAERHEPKGFLELVFMEVADGRSRCVDTTFHELPARPMVSLPLPEGPDSVSLYEYFRQATLALQPNAIVRIIPGAKPAPGLAQQLTAELLRAAFPSSMNVQLSRELVHAGQ